jgi:hypothetical protein
MGFIFAGFCSKEEVTRQKQENKRTVKTNSRKFDVVAFDFIRKRADSVSSK